MTFPTLHNFLHSIQLQQYYDAFLKAGAADQDLLQIIQFNEQEINELISCLDMLPFHSIKFKKAIRKFQLPQQTDIPTTSTQEFIKVNSVIYGKNNKRALTGYEEAINQASLEIAQENPLLVTKKGQLFELAKKKLLEDGYEYKRGSSRSKLKDKACHKKKKDVLEKRQENAKRVSEQRVEKIESLKNQVKDTILTRQQTELRLSFCKDSLSHLALEAEIIKCEETKIKLTKELSKLKSQERKHQWYEKRKLSSFSSSSTQEEFSISSLDTL